LLTGQPAREGASRHSQAETYARRMATGRGTLTAFALLALGPGLAHATGTGVVFVANEKSSTITVLDAQHRVIETFPTCARPRGMAFMPDHTRFIVGCADDDVIAVYEVASRKLVGRIRDVAEPETFALHPDGRHLYVSNEEDATASVYDLDTGELVGEFETGEEPEGVLATPDGKLVFVASEAANLVHVIDVERQEVIKDILVATRPRRFALTPDGKELWVSAELSGQVDIIDMSSLTVAATVSFRPKGFRREEVTPVDLLITRDGRRAFVALGRANHVAVVDVPSRQVEDYILVGHRPWGLALTADERTLYVANGLSDDVTIIDAERLKVVTSVAVGQVPYGFLIDDR
jgi:PQQ-dependent catabolism-associated beta-propeller protein